MRKYILGLICLFVFASLAFSAGSTKRDWVWNQPDDVSLGNTQQVLIDLSAASTTTIRSTIAIATTTLVANGTSYTLAGGGLTDVIFPRNLVADVYVSSNESTAVITGSLLVTGKNQFGESATETISMSTNSATGVVCWSTITSLVFSGFSVVTDTPNVSLSVGVGNKIALANNIEETGDIIKVIEAGATSTTYVLNTTYDSIDFASDPNATSDYYIYYIARTNKDRYKY
jgi:hypothetical protein